jgi:hypothetical protein
MAQPNQELREALVEEITEMCIRLMHRGWTLREIEETAYEHFHNRVIMGVMPMDPDVYLRKKFGI